MIWNEGSYTWPPVPNAGATALMMYNNSATNVVAPTPTNVPKKKGLSIKQQKRKQDLEADVWSKEVTAVSVGCRACDRDVQLDHRRGAQYSPWNWDKHMCDSRKLLLAKYDQVIESTRIHPERDD
jgi:hypothetical protein